MMKKRKYIRITVIIVLPLAFMFSQCLHQAKTTDPRGPQYAGSAACLKCHTAIYKDYFHSAHFLSSRPATAGDIHASFSPDSNTIVFNDSVKLVMEKRNDGIYQVKYVNGKVAEQHRFDMTLGSNRGETFFYWKGNQVYQLPGTYYINLHRWDNSPAYSGDSVNFSRVIGRRCFECHSSYVKNLPADPGITDSTTVFDKASMILGIDCERCHGPGAAHVNFQVQNPGEKQPRYITRIGSLSRQQRIDICSVCHSGNINIMTKSTFGFKPGDTLANYNSGTPFHAYQDAANVDVHGNQVKLLTGSKCFANSKIECATCHTIHSNAVKTAAVYSGYCTNCHSEANHNYCKIAAQMGASLTASCIDCHMPVKTSHSIVINRQGKQYFTPFVGRTHLIAVYPDESKKILAMLKASKPKAPQ